MHEHGQMTALNAVDVRVKDEDALEDVFELAHVARPGILLEQLQRVVANFNARSAVFAAEHARNSRASGRMSSLRSRSGGTKNGMTLRR